MDGKQSGHNDISPTKFNSIHHKVVINTNRVERIDSTDYNTSCNCEMRWHGDGDGADVGDDVDDDLDDARDDDDDNGDDLPGGICPPEMAFLLFRFPPRGVGETRKLFYIQGFHPRWSYRREGAPRGATRHPEGCLARLGGGGRARHLSGCLVGPLTSIFGEPQSIQKIMTPVNFHRIRG